MGITTGRRWLIFGMQRTLLQNSQQISSCQANRRLRKQEAARPGCALTIALRTTHNTIRELLPVESQRNTSSCHAWNISTFHNQCCQFRLPERGSCHLRLTSSGCRKPSLRKRLSASRLSAHSRRGPRSHASVSYTHLDVYKRQGVTTCRSRMPFPLCTGKELR